MSLKRKEPCPPEKKHRVYFAQAIKEGDPSYKELEPDGEYEVDKGPYIRTGPWTIFGCKHCSWYGPCSHGCNLNESLAKGCCNDRPKKVHVVTACIEQIQKSDIVFATFSKKEQYGTIAELSLACAKGIPVFLDADEKGNFDIKEYWFVITMALDHYDAYKRVSDSVFCSIQKKWKSILEYEMYWRQVLKLGGFQCDKCGTKATSICLQK